MSVSNIASAAVVASALKGGGSGQPSKQPDTIKESVAAKPIQWLVVVGVVGYFGYKMLKGVIKTGDDKKSGGAEESTTGNPWAFDSFLDWSKVPKNTKILTYEQATAKAQQVFNALNTYFDDSEDIAVGVFTQLPSQLQVAQVANAFYNAVTNGRDILTYLREGNKTFGFWTGGLSDANFQRVINNVAKKPKY